MGKFCGNCGAIMDDNASVCQSCGTPFNDEGQQYGEYDNGGYGNNNSYGGYDNNNSYGGYDNNGAYGAYPQGGSTDGMTQPPLTPNQEKVKKGIIFGAIGVGAVVVIIIVITVLTSIFGGGYKKAIDNYLDGINDGDMDKMLSGVSKVTIWKKLEDADEDEMEELNEEFKDTMEDMLEEAEDEVGKNPRLVYEIKDVDDLSERKTEDLLEYIEDTYDYEDIENITAVKVVDIKIKIKGSKKEKKAVSGNCYIIKDDGEWGIYMGRIPSDVDDSQENIFYSLSLF